MTALLEPSTLMTIDELREAMPSHLRKSVNDELLTEVNSALGDPNYAEIFKQNILNFNTIFREGKYKLHEYVNAVRYVSYKQMGLSNTEAYMKAFPDRYKQHINNGSTSSTIQSYISSYNKSKLVSAIMAQTIIPTWILNQGLYHDALSKLNDLMHNSKSEMVKYNAAAKLTDILRPPEVKKVELSLGISENSPLSQVEQSLAAIAKAQLGLIEQGMSAKDVAEMRTVKGEVIEHEMD